MTKDNEDALRCAEDLMEFHSEIKEPECWKSAAHLRRLVRENEFLSRALAVRNAEVIHAAQQLNAQDALLRQAVDALEQYTTPAQRLDGSPCREPINKQLCAAIRQHLEGRA